MSTPPDSAGGPVAIRGYLVQTLVALLDIAQAELPSVRDPRCVQPLRGGLDARTARECGTGQGVDRRHLREGTYTLLSGRTSPSLESFCVFLPGARVIQCWRVTFSAGTQRVRSLRFPQRISLQKGSRELPRRLLGLDAEPLYELRHFGKAVARHGTQLLRGGAASGLY